MKALGVWILSLALVAVLACAPASQPAATQAPAAGKPTEAPKPTAAAAKATEAAKPAAKAAPRQSVTVRISHAGSQTFRLPLYVAIQNGYFKDEGINLEVVDTQSGSDAMKMLAGKAVEFSTGQLLDAINLNKEGIHIQGVALLTERLGNSIVIRKALADQVKSMRDLKGPNRTIGVTSVGSGTWQFAVYMAKLEGVKQEEMNFVPVGAGANVIGAVKAGRVDALSFADPENFKLVEDGDAAFLMDLTDDATHKRLIGDTYLNNQIMVSADYIKQRPEVVQGFVDAIQRGLNWANSHSPEDVTKLLVSYPGFSNADPDLLVKSLRRMSNAVPKSAVISRAAFDNAIKFPIEIGVLSEPMPYDRLVNTEFAEKAAKQHPSGS